MWILQFVVFTWALAAVHALPLKRASSDLGILKFANVLEQLESNFYSQALAKFNASDFEAAGFVSSQVPIQQIQTIASDESTHAITLETIINALGGQTISGCTFNLSAALTDVNTMVTTARAIENVGVSAYLGALAALADPALITAGGGIMTVEARHQTILNLLSDATSIPQPFDMALGPADVLALAGAFISGCDLGLPANPPLTVTNSGSLKTGTTLNFSSPTLNGSIPDTQLSCQIFAGGLNSSIFQPICDCAVPANITGPMYVFITNNQQAAAAKPPMNSTMMGTPQMNSNSQHLVAGPALVFIDNQPDLIGNLVRPGLNNSGGNGITTTTTTTTTTQSSMLTTTSASFAAPTTVTLVTGTATSVATTSSVTATSAMTTPPSASATSMAPFTTTISPAEASAILASLASALPTLAG